MSSKEEKEKGAQARKLAKRHYDVEEGVIDVIRFTQNAQVEVQRGEPIKLLEVNKNTTPVGVMSIQFAPSPENGITYPIAIIEVTPDEYEQIKQNKLPLPPGWINQEPIPKPGARE